MKYLLFLMLTSCATPPPRFFFVPVPQREEAPPMTRCDDYYNPCYQEA